MTDKRIPESRADLLVVRPPLRPDANLGEIPLPLSVELDIDPVELLINDRRTDR